MPETIDPYELFPDDIRHACATIANLDAMAFDHRIKGILQVAHERLKTSSITAYAYNQATRILELIALPGVKERFFMYGDHSTPFMEWEKPDETGMHWAWLQDQEAHDALRKKNQSKDQKIAQVRTFEEREGLSKTLKACLYKGTGQLALKVGQIYFNFPLDWESRVGEQRYAEYRRCAVYIATLVRELLIQRFYQDEQPKLPRSVDANAFLERLHAVLDIPDQISSDADREVVSLIRSEFTRILKGHVEVILLVNDRLGKVYGDEPEPKILQFPEKSLTHKCAKESMWFMCDDLSQDIDEEKLGIEIDFPVSVNASGVVSRLTTGSVMVLALRDRSPGLQESRVRAVVRYYSSDAGWFESYKDALGQLERLSVYAMTRLENARQLRQQLNALNFYRGRNKPMEENEVLTQLARAMGADEVTFWPLGYRQPDDPWGLNVLAGKHVELNEKGLVKEAKNIEPDDRFDRRSIRSHFKKDEIGFTSAIVRGFKTPRPFFLIHHLCGAPMDKRSRPEGNQPDRYVLEFGFSNPDEPGTIERHIHAGGERLTDNMGQKMPLIKLRADDNFYFSALAFVVGDMAGSPWAVLWFYFNEQIHLVHDWEASFILGLAESLKDFWHREALSNAIEFFNHELPDQVSRARGQIDKLALITQDHNLACTLLSDLLICNRSLLNKSAELKALISKAGRSSFEGIAVHTIEEICWATIRLVAEFADHCEDSWEVKVHGKPPEDKSVPGVFFTALYNVLSNVYRHGFTGPRPPSGHFGFIWVGIEAAKFTVIVGNTGPEPRDGNPLNRGTRSLGPSGKEGHGLGLYGSWKLLNLEQGDLRYEPGSDQLPTLESKSVPQCTTRFTITLPYR
jgi:signal transduction histidine kinase